MSCLIAGVAAFIFGATLGGAAFGVMPWWSELRAAAAAVGGTANFSGGCL